MVELVVNNPDIGFTSPVLDAGANSEFKPKGKLWFDPDPKPVEPADELEDKPEVTPGGRPEFGPAENPDDEPDERPAPAAVALVARP